MPYRYLAGAKMSTARSARRTINSVFDKLDSDDPNRLNRGEDLQYPQELGTDEYNQFILFTIYEKNGDPALRNSANKVIETKRELDLAYERYRDYAAEQVQNYLSSPDAPADDWWRNFSWGLGEFSASVDVVFQRLTGAQFGGGDEMNDELRNAIVRLEQEYSQAQLEQIKSIENIEIKKPSFQSDRATPSVKILKELGLTERTQGRMIGRTRLAADTTQVATNIALYIPNKIVNNGTINYNSVDFSAGQQLSSIFTTGDLSSVFPTLKRKVAGALDSAGNVVGLQLNANEAIDAITGLVINPRQEQLFQSVGARTFDFSFSLAPRNQEESVIINKLIRAFRKYSHPKISSTNAFLEVPAEFEIRYYKIYNVGKTDEVVQENLFLNKIGRCVLQQVSVDYTPNGINATFEDGSPVRTSLTMTFQEMRPLVREDIEEGY